jgi:hypothetical protein
MNVTYAFQVAATNGNGFSVFFRDPNFVTFRVTGNGTVTAGAVTIETSLDNMTAEPASGSGNWTSLTTITVPAKSTVDYNAGIVSGTFRARISTLVTGGTVTDICHRCLDAMCRVYNGDNPRPSHWVKRAYARWN